MNKKKGYLYIIGNNRPTLYIGVTSDLVQRIYQHKNSFVDAFSKKYKLNKLLYYEVFDDIKEAIQREKQLKNWHREWKLKLIKNKNPLSDKLQPPRLTTRVTSGFYTSLISLINRVNGLYRQIP